VLPCSKNDPPIACYGLIVSRRCLDDVVAGMPGLKKMVAGRF